MALDLLAWAKRFIATPSVSSQGNVGMARLAADLLRSVGVEARIESVVDEGVEQCTVIADVTPAHPGTSDGDGVLLLTHLDTVPPGDSALWTRTGCDPFRPTIDGDCLYGLGSADAKVDLICKAAALESLDRGRLRRRIRIVGTFGEEIGLRGARHFAASGGTQGLRYGLVGEPSDLAVIRAHKGYAVFEARIPLPQVIASGIPRQLCVDGTAAHSSTPALGSNAIELACERLAHPDVRGLVSFDGGGSVNVVPARAKLTVCLGDADDSAATLGSSYDPAPIVAFQRVFARRLRELSQQRDADFDPDHTVGNLGHVQLRDGACVLRFDLRPIPGVSALEAVAPLRDFAEVTLVRENPPLATPAASRLVRVVTDAHRAVDWPSKVATKATSTEAGLMSAQGLEVIVMGAGTSVGNVHKPNEHTRISQLSVARDLYTHVLRALCEE